MSTPTATAPTTVLADAENCIFGDRNRDYGSPKADFACSAAMISAYLNRRFNMQVALEPYDIGQLMILVKAARVAHAPKHDSFVDQAGYAACSDWTLNPEIAAS